MMPGFDERMSQNHGEGRLTAVRKRSGALLSKNRLLDLRDIVGFSERLDLQRVSESKCSLMTMKRSANTEMALLLALKKKCHHHVLLFDFDGSFPIDYTGKGREEVCDCRLRKRQGARTEDQRASYPRDLRYVICLFRLQHFCSRQ